MLVGVGREGLVALDLVELADRVGAVLVVLAENGARLGLEAAPRVVEVLEAVGLDLQDLLQVLLRERRVVVGVVVRRVGVLPRAGLGHDLPGTSPAGRPSCRGTSCARRSGRSPDLPGSTSLRDPVCTGIWSETMFGKPGRHDDDLQAVGERLLGGLERQDVAGGLRGLRGRLRGGGGEAGFVVWALAWVATRASRTRATGLMRRMRGSPSVIRNLSLTATQESPNGSKDSAYTVGMQLAPFPGGDLVRPGSGTCPAARRRARRFSFRSGRRAATSGTRRASRARVAGTPSLRNAGVVGRCLRPLALQRTD